MNALPIPLSVPWILQEIEWISEDLRHLLSDLELAAYRRFLLLEFRTSCVLARSTPSGIDGARALHLRLRIAERERRRRLDENRGC